MDLSLSLMTRSVRAVVRNITTLDPTFSQYFKIPTVTAAGDFELEMEFSTTATREEYLFDSDIDLIFKGRVNANGTVGLLVGNGATWVVNIVGTSTFNDGKIHVYTAIKEGDNYTLLVDGAVEAVITRAGSVTPNVKFIGVQRGIYTYFDGTISNVNFKSGWSQTGNPTGGSHYEIKEAAGATVLVNSNADLGAEVWADTGEFFNAAGSVTAGLLVFEATSSYGGYTLSGLGLLGTDYVISFSVAGSVGSNVVINTRSGSNELDSNLAALRFGNGDHKVKTTLADFNKIQLRLQNAGNEVTVSNISIRQAPGYGEIINSPSVERFTEQANGDWLGIERVANGGFDSDTGWTKGAGWTIADGVAQHDGSAAGELRSVTAVITPAATYRVGITRSAPVASMALVIAGAYLPATLSAGRSISTYIAGTGGSTFGLQGGGPYVGEDNLSVKRIIQKA